MTHFLAFTGVAIALALTWKAIYKRVTKHGLFGWVPEDKVEAGMLTLWASALLTVIGILIFAVWEATA